MYSEVVILKYEIANFIMNPEVRPFLTNNKSY